jgi:hypothetical protein
LCFNAVIYSGAPLSVTLALAPMKAPPFCAVLATILWLLVAPSGPAQIPYTTNLNQAFAVASEQNRTIVLFTGRSVHCQGKTPHDYFFSSIASNYPGFLARSNRYVVCEQFMFTPDATNRALELQFMQETIKYGALFDRYPIQVYYPAVTFLDKTGHMLNGPFWTMAACGDWFHSSKDEHYPTLTNYFADDPPKNMDVAESNLVAAVFPPGGKKSVFGLFRSVFHKEGGQTERVLQNGLTSREYEIGAPIRFSVRETRVKREQFDHWYEETSVFVIGRFTGTETFRGLFLVQLNGGWFPTCMFPFEKGYPYDWQRRIGIQMQPGDYYFIVQTRSDRAGRALYNQMLGLKPGGTSP